MGLEDFVLRRMRISEKEPWSWVRVPKEVLSRPDALHWSPHRACKLPRPLPPTSASRGEGRVGVGEEPPVRKQVQTPTTEKGRQGSMGNNSYRGIIHTMIFSRQ